MRKRKPLIRLRYKKMMIETGDGKIPYEDWCKREVVRIGRGAHLIREGNTVGVMDKKKAGQR